MAAFSAIKRIKRARGVKFANMERVMSQLLRSSSLSISYHYHECVSRHHRTTGRWISRHKHMLCAEYVRLWAPSLHSDHHPIGTPRPETRTAT